MKRTYKKPYIEVNCIESAYMITSSTEIPLDIVNSEFNGSRSLTNR